MHRFGALISRPRDRPGQAARHVAGVVVAVCLATTGSAGAEAVSPQAPPEKTAVAAAEMPTTAAEWLHRLESLSRDRAGLDARLRYTTVQGLLDDEQVRYGRLRVAHHTGSPEHRGAGAETSPDRFRIDLDGEAIDGTLRKLQRRLVWDGERLLDADALRREASVRVLQGEDELTQTLPIPLRVDAADLLARYEVELLPRAAGDASGAGSTVHLRLLRRDDEQADPMEVWFDGETGFPLRGRSGRVGGDTRSVELVGAQAVAGFEKHLFDTAPPRGDGWRVQAPTAAD